MAKAKADEKVATESVADTKTDTPAPAAKKAQGLRYQYFISEDRGFVLKNQDLKKYLGNIKPSGWNYVTIPESLGLDKKKVIEDLTASGALKAMYVGAVSITEAQ